MDPRRWLMIVAFLTPTLAPEVEAQATWRARLELDNDVYNYWRRHSKRPDEEYTNGVHASLETPSAPWWGAKLSPRIADCVVAATATPCRSTVLTLGQDIYTPNLDRTPYAVPGWEQERPFFAWLFVRGVARVSSERSLSSTSVALGVTGPPAGGELAQQVAHRIGFNEPPEGWDTQIGFEPGVIIDYRRSMLLTRRAPSDRLGFDIAPAFGFALGNIRTHAEAGARLRLGQSLSHPWHAPLWRVRRPLEWWLSASGHATYVARDMSLDGTLVGATRRVDRRPGVLRYEFGAGLRWRGTMFEYRAVTTSREYASGPMHHAYSTMTVAVVPW